MFSTTLVSATALSLLAARGALADFSLTASAFTQCQPAHLTWTGTSQAVNILLVPADKPCDETLVDLGDHSKGAMSWNVSLPAGTQLLVSAEDAKGEEAWSQTITVGASSDTSCLSAQQRASLPQTGTSGSTSGSSSSSGSASSSTSQTTTQGNTPTPDNNNNNNNTPTSDPSGNGDDSALNGLLGAANAGVGPKASSSAATLGSSAPFALAFSALVGASAVALF